MTNPSMPPSPQGPAASWPPGCTRGHPAAFNPAINPRYGLVPSRPATILGGLAYSLLGGLLLWLAPAWFGWYVVILAILAVLGFGAQWLLGHRGACAKIRGLRWWLAPIAALFDPFDGD